MLGVNSERCVMDSDVIVNDVYLQIWLDRRGVIDLAINEHRGKNYASTPQTYHDAARLTKNRVNCPTNLWHFSNRHIHRQANMHYLNETQILMKKLFSPSCGSTQARFRIGSAQEILILSGVAGLCRCSTEVSPNSALAAFNASRIAKKTLLPINSGGSPDSISNSTLAEER